MREQIFVFVEMGRFELPSELGIHTDSTVCSFSFGLKYRIYRRDKTIRTRFTTSSIVGGNTPMTTAPWLFHRRRRMGRLTSLRHSGNVAVRRGRERIQTR